jgi:hypothetical protein
VSYDLQVWTTASFVDASTMPDSGWVETNGNWSKSGKGWLVNVSANQQVLQEDIPEDVNGALPGIRFLTELSLEPIHAPKSARRLARTCWGSSIPVRLRRDRLSSAAPRRWQTMRSQGP